jgi:hypothetical protein
MKTKKKKSKIIRRKAGTKSNMYFNEDTADAIASFQQSTDEKEKENLYVTRIFPAFDKLAENLIFIHGFKGLHDTYEDLKGDCVTFLYEAINKFDRTRGTKPFSYFNVVAKRWLIIRSKQRMTKMKRNLSMHDEGLSMTDKEKIESHQIVCAPDEQLEAVEFVLNVHKLLGKIRERVTTQSEMQCIDAVLHLFNVVDDGSAGEDLLLNKRAVFMYMRDLSGLNAKQLTMTIASIKKHYKDLRSSDECGIY